MDISAGIICCLRCCLTLQGGLQHGILIQRISARNSTRYSCCRLHSNIAVTYVVKKISHSIVDVGLARTRHHPALEEDACHQSHHEDYLYVSIEGPRKLGCTVIHQLLRNLHQLMSQVTHTRYLVCPRAYKPVQIGKEYLDWKHI